MSHHSALRRLAFALMGHAVRMLPPARAEWGAAMAHELHHIESDLEAVTWAAGCVLASYVERTAVTAALQTLVVRGVIALLIATQVLAFLFATALTLAYRLNDLRLAAFLGSFTPGDDYRRFIPLMDATPWWLHTMWVVASILFFVSAWQLLRNRTTAFPLFAAACLLGVTGNLVSQTMPAYRDVFSFPAPVFTRDYLIPVASALIPAFVAVALWVHARWSLADGAL